MMSTTSNIAIKRSPDGELIVKSRNNDDDLTSVFKNIILFFVNVFCVWPVSKFFEIVTR